MGKKELKKIFGKKVVFRTPYSLSSLGDCVDALITILSLSGCILIIILYVLGEILVRILTLPFLLEN